VAGCRSAYCRQLASCVHLTNPISTRKPLIELF
jgi:hypothetical protein